MSTQLKTPVADDMTPEARRTYIGASDLPVICGVSPFKSPFRLALEKRGEIATDDLTGNPYVEAGNELEPFLRSWYARKSGLKINARHVTFIHSKYDFLRCHVDGNIVADKRGPGLFEAKTAGYWAGLSEDWGEPETDEYPMPYHVQNQGALAITRWTWGRLAALIGGNDFRPYPIEADESLQDAIVERAVKFWEAVQSGRLDDLDRTTADVKSMFPHSVAAVVEASESVTDDVRISIELLEKKAAAEAEVRQFEKQLDPVRARVMHYMGTHDTLTIGGAPVITWKEQSRKGYTVEPTTFRVFRRVAAKGN